MDKVVSKLFELDKLQHVCKIIKATKPLGMQFEYCNFQDVQFLDDEISEGLDTIENYMKDMAISSKFEAIVLFALAFRNEKASLLISVKESRYDRSFDSSEKAIVKVVFHNVVSRDFEEEIFLINIRRIVWNIFEEFKNNGIDFERDLRMAVYASK